MSVAFDTLKFSQRAQESGFNKQQAEFIAEEWVSARDNDLATKQDILMIKQDLLNLKNEIKQDLANLKNEMLIDLANLKNEMIIKLGSLMVVGMTILGFIIKH